MRSSVIAMAGVAEGIADLAIFMMWTCLAIIVVISLIGFCKPSRSCIILAIAAYVLFSLTWQPWFCLAPMPEDAKYDPDIVDLTIGLWCVGAGWLLIGAWLFGSWYFEQSIRAWGRAACAWLSENK